VCGYNEIQHPPIRKSLVDIQCLQRLFNCSSSAELQKSLEHNVQTFLEYGQGLTRDSKWTESIAVGNGDFVNDIAAKLHFRRRSLRINRTGESYELNEPLSPYLHHFQVNNIDLRSKNTYLWKL